MTDTLHFRRLHGERERELERGERGERRRLGRRRLERRRTLGVERGAERGVVWRELHIDQLGDHHLPILIAPLHPSPPSLPPPPHPSFFRRSYYSQRASPGGLLITEATNISPEAMAYMSVRQCVFVLCLLCDAMQSVVRVLCGQWSGD